MLSAARSSLSRKKATMNEEIVRNIGILYSPKPYDLA